MFIKFKKYKILKNKQSLMINFNNLIFFYIIILYIKRIKKNGIFFK